MKKLITICLLLLSAFAANAQTENFNEEQTIKYINETWNANYQKLYDCWPELYINDDFVIRSAGGDSSCWDTVYDNTASMYSKPIVRVKTHKNPKDSSMTLYMVTCDTWPLITCIKSEATAEKLKNAVIHLYKLIESRK
jgi:hypothetical protein